MLVYSAAITRYQSPSKHQHVQHITLRLSVASVDRSVEWEFCLTKHKLYIVTILKCRVFILLFIFLKVWHVHDRILAKMVSISPNIYTAIAHHVAAGLFRG